METRNHDFDKTLHIVAYSMGHDTYLDSKLNNFSFADRELVLAAGLDGVAYARFTPDGRIVNITTTACQSESLCIDWKSENVYSSGCRNGSIYLFDSRTKLEQRGTLRLRHHRSATRIRWVDGNHIVAAGVENKVGDCIRDLPIFITNEVKSWQCTTYGMRLASIIRIGLQVKSL